MKWTNKFPNKIGTYWFYGYRYGRDDGYGVKKEYMIVEVMKCSNGLLIKANGQFMYEGEIEEGIFCKCEYPKLPEGVK